MCVELVGDDERIPVVVVAESGRIGRRMREDDDSVGWKRRRVSVHVVDVVGDDEIDRAARWHELGRQLGVCALGVDSRAPGFGFERRA